MSTRIWVRESSINRYMESSAWLGKKVQLLERKIETNIGAHVEICTAEELQTVTFLNKGVKEFFHKHSKCQYASQLKWKSKQRNHLQKELNAMNVHVDSARAKGIFYDSYNSFAHAFLTEFVTSSWYSLQSFLACALNEFLYGQPKFIRVWCGRGMVFTSPNFAEDGSIGTPPNCDAPSIPSVQDTCTKKEVLSSWATAAYISLCLHEEALRGTFSRHTEISENHLIAQCIVSATDNRTEKGRANKLIETILIFVKGCHKLFSQASSTCSQVLNLRKQHC